MIDYPFLAEYLEKEISRLREVADKQEKWIRTYQDEIPKKESALKYQNVRTWEYQLGIDNAKKKILECDIKLASVYPKIDKLAEQVLEIRKFINQ